jgi:hypothetical protein
MTKSVFAGAGLNLDGQPFPQWDAGISTNKIKSVGDSLSEAESGQAFRLSEAGVNTLADVANRHSVTPEALKDIIAATLQAYSHRPLEADPSLKSMPSLAETNFQPSLRQNAACHQPPQNTASSSSKHLYEGSTKFTQEAFDEIRTTFREWWRATRQRDHKALAAIGVLGSHSLKEIADEYLIAMLRFDKVPARALLDLLRMQSIADEQQSWFSKAWTRCREYMRWKSQPQRTE